MRSGQSLTGRRRRTAAARPEVIKAIPIRHWGRWISAVIIVYVAIALLFSFPKNPNIEWHVIGPTCSRRTCSAGVLATLEITFASMAVGVVGGVLLAVMRLSANRVLSTGAGSTSGSSAARRCWSRSSSGATSGALYQTVVHRPALQRPCSSRPGRDGPLDDPGIVLVGILALGLNEAAYMAEIVRAGIISVDGRPDRGGPVARHVAEGLTMRRIVLPQAMRVIIPPWATRRSHAQDDVAGVGDRRHRAAQPTCQIVYAQTFQIIPLLIVASIWYLVFTTIMTIGQYYIEAYYGPAGPGRHGRPPQQAARRRSRRARGPAG